MSIRCQRGGSAARLCLGFYALVVIGRCRVTVTADPDLRHVRLALSYGVQNATSAASRPMPCALDRPGPHSRGVEQVSAGTGGPVQERLENRVEVRRVQAPRVRADIAGRNAQGTAERDAQVGEVSVAAEQLTRPE